MPIQLGTYTFEESTVTSVEKYEEVGGRDGRIIRIKGLLCAYDSFAEIEAQLDAILAAATNSDDEIALLLRPDRRLWVRRIGFERQVQREERVGSFSLILKADNPNEESVMETSDTWNVTSSGATLALSTAGNRPAKPLITLVATGNVINPQISDGVNAIRFGGVVADGQSLVFDPGAGRVSLEGVDKTWLSSGAFPVIAPGGATFTYTDAPFSSHDATITVAYRDTWY